MGYNRQGEQLSYTIMLLSQNLLSYIGIVLLLIITTRLCKSFFPKCRNMCGYSNKQFMSYSYIDATLDLMKLWGEM